MAVPARWIPPTVLGGAWQMAIDGWLLEQRQPAFRLYRWRRPTLSLGFHQHSLEPHWHGLAAAGVIDLVRRPSGGRAVLHAGDLTYALVWPDAGGDRRRAYGLACGWLGDAFQRMGLPLQAGRQAISPQRSNCFASGTAADLVHASGAKRVGSAQLWRSGCLLQHGSILVEPPAALWRQVFLAEPPELPPLPLQGEALERLLCAAALAGLPTAAAGHHVQPLGEQELAAIAQRRPRYAVTSCTTPLASPEASIERTTWGSASPRG